MGNLGSIGMLCGEDVRTCRSGRQDEKKEYNIEIEISA